MQQIPLMCSHVVAATLSCGGCHDSQAPQCHGSHGRGIQRQLDLGKVPSNTVFSLQQQNISTVFQETFQKGQPCLAAEMLEQRKIGASVRVWSEGPLEAVALRTDPMCGEGAGSGQSSTVQTSPPRVQMFALHGATRGLPSFPWDLLGMRPPSDGRQGSVRSGSSQLLSTVRWSSHSHHNYRSLHHTANFPTHVICCKHT